MIPVRLAQHEGERLVSRLQAKRLVARFEEFAEVILDFTGVSDLGPSCVDEIFRVFQGEHPDVSLTPVGATLAVDRAIKRAQRSGQPPLL